MDNKINYRSKNETEREEKDLTLGTWNVRGTYTERGLKCLTRREKIDKTGEMIIRPKMQVLSREERKNVVTNAEYGNSRKYRKIPEHKKKIINDLLAKEKSTRRRKRGKIGENCRN